MRNIAISLAAAALVIATMALQIVGGEPTLSNPPKFALGEIPGFKSEKIAPGEAELHTLPSDTFIDKRVYTAADGMWFQIALVVGGRSKSSIHRPELCLPSQGFQMANPRDLTVEGVDWRVLSLLRQDAPECRFAYTFFNQDGFRTSSHVRRIFRDVWDRSFHGRIDRWAMLTVYSPSADTVRLLQFVAAIGKGE